ncbi:MAG TPA: hypothetical protein VMV49_16990 [Candidatus Deferrimicrobium sp.]|nr:hypothetical protein [Candidatus Deferrimicrobium sp.]
MAKEKILENYVEPDATGAYLFLERAQKQIKPINDDQGYMMGFFNLYYSGTFKNDSLKAFKNELLEELNYSLKTYEYFKVKTLNLLDYKFGLVDNTQEIHEFDVMDEIFFEELKDSWMNLIIVGKNFDLTQFKNQPLFLEWFKNYANK